MLDYPAHLGALSLVAGLGCLLFWGITKFVRSKGDLAEHRWVHAALAPMIVILVLTGWVNLLSGARTPVEIPAAVRDFAVGVLVGLAAGVTAVKIGVRLEQRRFEEGRGPTPRIDVLKRALFFFGALSVVDGALLAILARGAVLRLAVLSALCGFWITAAVIYRRRAGTKPPSPARSIARRATLFGLAVTAIAGVACPGFGVLCAGIWAGVGLAVSMLLATAWSATRHRTPGAVFLGGAVASVFWLLLCFSARAWL